MAVPSAPISKVSVRRWQRWRAAARLHSLAACARSVTPVRVKVAARPEAAAPGTARRTVFHCQSRSGSDVAAHYLVGALASLPLDLEGARHDVAGGNERGDRRIGRLPHHAELAGLPAGRGAPALGDDGQDDLVVGHGALERQVAGERLGTGILPLVRYPG